MKPIRPVAFGLVSLLGLTTSAQAGWQSAFQVTCFGCSSPAASSYYGPADACCQPPPPQQVCTTKYVQRCFYQPVTSYQTRSYYEPVTTYRTSYYYEPVTTYRTSYYFDPCTCCYKQACTPCTSYKLRSQCCPVQSFVQRCCSVPVTTYKQCCYWEPQTSCSLVDPCANATSTYQPPAASPPPAATYQPPAVPAVTEQHQWNPSAPQVQPSVEESRHGGTSGSKLYDQYNPSVPAKQNSFDMNNNFYRYPAQPYQYPAAKPAMPVVPKPNYITHGDPGKTKLLGIQLVSDR